MTADRSRTACVALWLSLVVLSSGATLAGDLEPPGPPAPTMLPLNEVEARFPVREADMPLTITMPGSYYLVEDVTVDNGDGILIATVDVSIDLNGFALFGGTGTGISVTTATEDIEVRNGIVAGWEGAGIDLGLAKNSRVADVRVLGNGGVGIQLGDNGLVRDVVSSENNSHNIAIGDRGSVLDSVTGASQQGRGISAGAGAVISRCTTRENFQEGIRATDAAQVTGNSASLNGGAGIVVLSGGTVRDNNVFRNTGDGISVLSRCAVESNTATENGWNPGDAAGILVNGNFNRIDGNNATGNDRGIDVDASQNVIVRNSAADNGVEYSIVGGNQVGPIGTADTATSPWSNLDF